MKPHTITFDWGNLRSVERAQTNKQHLENKGYKLVGTRQVGLERFRMTYQKPTLKRR